MFFGKNDHLVGLDIGSKVVKAGEIIASKKGFSLKKFGMLQLSPGTIEEGAIKDPENAAACIRELFQMHRIKSRNVAISIGGYSVIVKNIVTQSMSEDDLQDTIHIEAEQYIPFDINDVNLDFLILGEADTSPNQMNVLLIAVKKEIVSDYVNLIKLAGLNPCIIDVDAFALQNIYEINYDVRSQNVALIDIGASKTSLNILKAGNSAFIRDVSLGCSQINHRIMSETGCDFLQAEKIKLGQPTDTISAENIKAIEADAVSGWCAEIRRALDFFYSNYPDDAIGQVILSGGGANIPSFRETLSTQTSIEVTTIDPFQRILKNDDKNDTDYLSEVAPQAAICLGLALRRVNDK
jgi:type IV pilus assembly protein PilM